MKQAKYKINDRVQWSDWADEPNRTGVIIDVDQRYNYYTVDVDPIHAGGPHMCMGTPEKFIEGLADPLPDNVVNLDDLRRNKT